MVEIYEKIKGIFNAYASIPDLIKEKIKEIFSGKK
jgi:hypothetical protein